jgi:hypothetical protein
MPLSLSQFWVFGISTGSDVVWSVIILLCCGLLFTAYCVAYILILASKEMSEDEQVPQPRQEGICGKQEAESGKCHSKES